MRWSQESVSSITALTLTSPSRTTGRGVSSPTARIAACGGVITATKRLIPYMPRVETGNVPPQSARGGLELLAELDGLLHVDLECDDEVRRRRLGLGHPPRDRPLQPRELDGLG